jgi:hypothetical protein
VERSTEVEFTHATRQTARGKGKKIKLNHNNIYPIVANDYDYYHDDNHNLRSYESDALNLFLRLFIE